MNPLFERSLLVFDEKGISQLQKASVLIAGIGGVGGFVAEALARAGVGHLTLVDHDVVGASNLNRQILALNSTLGQSKVAVMTQRIMDINPNCRVTQIQQFLNPDDMSNLLSTEYDAVVDAIDSLNCKVSLVESAYKKGLNIFSSMGAGRRIDPSQIRIADISKTHTCALARNMRQRLKKQGIYKGIPVIFSTELPMKPGPMELIEGARGRVVNGTASYMPGIYGLMLAGLVVQKLTASSD